MTGEADYLLTFPIPVLTPFATLTTPPTFQTLQNLQKELNANAQSVHSDLGGGNRGHLTLTVATIIYDALLNVIPFVVPPAPAPLPDMSANTQYQINAAVRKLADDTQAFKKYHNTDKALRKQLIAATPPVYIDALSDPDYGFGSVTCLQLLTHLWTTYGTLSIADKDANLQRMATPWHPPTPIETLFKQLQDGMRLAAAAGEPQVDAQVARLGYNIIFKTGLFADACREWRLKPEAQQTLAIFQTHFQRMNMDRLASLTTETAGYHGAANAAIESPPPTLESVMAELASLKAAQANAAQGPPVAPTAPKPILPPTHYCWTHGASRNAAHTSATCRNKLPGHLDAATLTDQMGGSARVWTRPPRRTQQ